ncbi:hypothetical protein V1523DRAFT_369644, partial [Lipomyces doorenjongii]
MAEYKFCWIPAGGPDSRRAGKPLSRHLGGDAETNWGPDFVNTMRSIYIPLKSELSDTFNRHYWLHKTEYRLSQIRLVQVDEDDLLADHAGFQGVTLEAVTEFTKSYTAGLSSSILKYIVSFDEDGYTDDFAAMVDESVDLGDVAESHMKSVTGGLGDYVKTADPAEKTAKERVLAKAISSDGSALPTTGSAVHATLSPFVNL